MRLTLYTDYALRVLIHLGVHGERLSSIEEMAGAYGISRNHLTKIVHDLGKAGYVTSQRGRGGGVRLARAPDEINVGDLVRHTEEDIELADCGNCVISPACGLSPLLHEALEAFLAVLDRATLADLIKRRRAIGRLLAGV